MALETATPVATTPSILPVQVVGPVDIGRLSRELTALHEAMMEQGLRGVAEPVLPKMSALLSSTAELNKLDLQQQTAREQLLNFLNVTKAKAPLMHISFSTDPSADFLEKLVGWMRREIHPQVLLTIGLQPNIGAGCILRSSNKYFDMSLKKDMQAKRSILLDKLSALVSLPASAALVAGVPTPEIIDVTTVAVQKPVPEVQPAAPVPVAKSGTATPVAPATAVHQTIHQVPQGVAA